MKFKVIAWPEAMDLGVIDPPSAQYISNALGDRGIIKNPGNHCCEQLGDIYQVLNYAKTKTEYLIIPVEVKS